MNRFNGSTSSDFSILQKKIQFEYKYITATLPEYKNITVIFQLNDMHFTLFPRKIYRDFSV